MGLLGNIFGTIIDTATLPISIIKDVATMGGELTDNNGTYTQEKIEKIGEDFKNLDDNLRKL